MAPDFGRELGLAADEHEGTRERIGRGEARYELGEPRRGLFAVVRHLDVLYERIDAWRLRTGAGTGVDRCDRPVDVGFAPAHRVLVAVFERAAEPGDADDVGVRAGELEEPAMVPADEQRHLILQRARRGAVASFVVT